MRPVGRIWCASARTSGPISAPARVLFAAPRQIFALHIELAGLLGPRGFGWSAPAAGLGLRAIALVVAQEDNREPAAWQTTMTKNWHTQSSPELRTIQWTCLVELN